MKTPKIIINFKTYKEATQQNALKLAKLCEKLSKKHKINITIAPQTTDIHLINSKTKIPLYAQHFDTKKQGKNTGSTTIQAIKKAGAIGSIINHSEHQISTKEIKKSIKIAKKNKIKLTICSESIQKSKEIAKLKPESIAFEIPELIGGNKSITTAQPKKIKQVITTIKKTSPKTLIYCGAGIKTKKDCQKAIELGINGILISSGFIKSKNQTKTLNELIEPFKKKAKK